MVAIIQTGHSIKRTLNYNENKVKEGVAECLSAQNYLGEPEKLSFSHKLNRLVNQAELNENVTRNSVHVSLNFGPSEKISNEKLKEIADSYMQKIGFAKQPYLVYRHFDAGHPHIHIVSVKVRSDGSRIDTQNIGRNQSEKARKEIEIAYGLVRAETIDAKKYELKPAYPQKIQYGISDSRKAIANVLEVVLNTYKYSSLPELNAVLQQHNVLADRGSESSRVYKHRGLLYHILDDKGTKTGVPIKASSFYNKPTLKALEEKFVLNESSRQPHKARVKNAIDLAFIRQPGINLQELINTLNKQGINSALRQNEEGFIYGVTYVDHNTKCVFNGSVLGKQYSAKGLLERCGEIKETATQQHGFVQQLTPKTTPLEEQTAVSPTSQSGKGNDVLEILLHPEQASAYVPYQLTQKGRKKRKNRISKHL